MTRTHPFSVCAMVWRGGLTAGVATMILWLRQGLYRVGLRKNARNPWRLSIPGGPCVTSPIDGISDLSALGAPLPPCSLVQILSETIDDDDRGKRGELEFEQRFGSKLLICDHPRCADLSGQ